MAITTKKDLQERITALESQVTDLQNELSQTAFALSDAEDQLAISKTRANQLYNTEQLLRYEKANTIQLAYELEAMSSQFAWALSMTDAIYLYPGPYTKIKKNLIGILGDETLDFIEKFDRDDFKAETILDRFKEEGPRPSYHVTTNIEDPMIKVFTDILGTDPVDQEVPDDLEASEAPSESESE